MGRFYQEVVNQTINLDQQTGGRLINQTALAACDVVCSGHIMGLHEPESFIISQHMGISQHRMYEAVG